MSNRVLIEIVGQDHGLDEANAKLDTLSQKEKQILADMKALEQERNKAKAYATTAEQMAAAEQKFGKMVEDNVKKLKEVRKEQDASRKSIEALSNAQKAMPGKIIAENTAKSFRTLKREIDEQLRTWSDWSAAGTEAYNKLMEKAGEMNDTMGDTNRMIQYMGSDTKGFDTLVDGTQAVAGGFSVAQGAMALFGSESEDLQLMMVKLQSAIAISTGLQQIGNVVQKESNLMMGIAVMQNKAKATAELLSTKTTIGATIAQKAFNLAAKANPYVLLAIALITVVGALVAFTSGSNKAEKQQRLLNKAMEDSKTIMSQMAYEYELQEMRLDALGASQKEKLAERIKYLEKNKNEQARIYNELLKNEESTSEQIKEAGQSLLIADQELRKSRYALKMLTLKELKEAEQKAEDDAKTNAKERLQKIKDDQQKEFDALRDYYTKVNEARIQDQTDAEKIAQTKIPITEEEINEVKDYLDIIQHQYNMGLISYDDYLKKKKAYLIEDKKDLDAVNEEIYKNEQEKLKEHEAKKREIMQESVQLMGDIGNIFLDYKKEQLSQEMSDLEHFYTTDIEEAKKNKNLKLISEKEFAARQLDIKRKQAIADKQQAIFNIGISTAMGIMSALGSIPPNPILAAFIGVTGAAQAIAVAAKPLPKYAKGRKSGQGEFAMVGEQGPELMWVPQMAGIMPAHETQRALNGDWKAFDRWNMPPIDRWIPLPDISQKVNNEINRKESIDYDLLASKIGEHVGRRVKIPRGKNVTVNVDNTGVTVEENNTRTRILNKKYNG